MRYESSISGLPERPLQLAAAGVALGVALAVAALIWANSASGTNCHIYDARPPVDPATYLRPIFVGCELAGIALAVLLVTLSLTRRRAAHPGARRPGIPSTSVAAVTAWCAVAYLPLVFGWSLNGYNGVLAKSFWGPPLTLLLAVALLVAYLQYALFLAPLGLLVATGIAPRCRKGRYRLMQITIVCALVGCIAVALGADFIVAGVCIHD